MRLKKCVLGNNINNDCLLNTLQLKNWITVLKYMWIHYNTKTILSYLQVKISINNIYKKIIYTIY